MVHVQLSERPRRHNFWVWVLNGAGSIIGFYRRDGPRCWEGGGGVGGGDITANLKLMCLSTADVKTSAGEDIFH